MLLNFLVGLLAAAVLFVLLMVLCRPFNKWIARRCGAPIGRSFSAHLWAIEQDGEWLGEILRPLVDYLFSKKEADHCRTAYMREAA